MLEVVLFARSTICHRARKKALAPSALLSGDGSVCLQQLNQSLKNECDNSHSMDYFMHPCQTGNEILVTPFGTD